ncbi:MAG: DUF6364 family protein [Bryobacteraceae bacterium]
MSKLTLSIDESVITRAKEYAKSRGISVSEMVETYLARAAAPAEAANAPRILRALRGSLKKAHPKDYRKHLVKKYR